MILWSAMIFCVASYLLGAIPFGFIIAKQLKGIDIREHGSGNVGATNVKRVVGNKAGTATLVLDGMKGVIPVLAAPFFFSSAADPQQLMPLLGGLFAVIGHTKSIYIGFSGGKAVITSLGVLISLQPLAAACMAVVAISVIKLTRYVSLGSITGAALTPLFFWLFHAPVSHLCLACFVGAYVIYLHRSNIQRLLTHQENRL